MPFITRLLVVFVMMLAAPLHAQMSEWQHHESSDFRLIASTKASEDGALYAAMHLKLKDGWHAYWRSPGDAGFPPSPEWKDSVNLEKAELLFPWPHRYAMQGLETYGYQGEVVFPIKITRKDPNAALNLKGKITLLVCSDICVPVDFNLNFDLPAGFASADGDEATGLIKTFLAHVPKQDNGTGLTLASAAISQTGETRSVTLHYNAPQTLNELEIVGEVGDGSTLPFADIKHDAAAKKITATLTKDAPKELSGKEIVFTLIDVTNQIAVEKKLALTGDAVAVTAPVPVAHAAPQANILTMILFALIGGLILNLMPCVLPVLALKSLAFISHGGGTTKGVRLSFLATSSGILFSFLVMAGIIIALKHVGMSVGWGVQFQNPVFLIFLIVIVLLFAFNLLGLFEIPLPRFLADRLSWTQGHGSLTKDFFSGAFATLLATPCTAPFLGTAVGFALAGSGWDVLAIFMALGFGLASPFLLIAAFPKTATLLPKPGAWMENVRKFLGVLLAITALWLGWVLYNQTIAPSLVNAQTQQQEIGWEKFDEAKIPQLISQGKIVYVDVTADWCLTCQVNKKLVLDNAETQKLLSDSRIVKMKADWTSRDESIGNYLKSFGRFGIPFNVIYSSVNPQGEPLPELLSNQAVREGLTKAGL